MKKSKSDIKNIPTLPGVYLLYNDKSEIIYIGKAKNLKNRLSTYFRNVNDTYKTKLLKKQLKYYEFILTKTEEEALLLENNLIKKYKPKFNIMLKDDKTYPYIAYNKKMDYPYLYFTRVKKLKKNTVYIGPYTNAHGLKLFLDYINDKFQLRRCHGKLPDKPCIYFSLKKCSAPCITNNKKFYNISFDNALKFLKYPAEKIIKIIQEEMFKSSQNLQFERAASLRDIIAFLKKRLEKQYVSNQKRTFDAVTFIYEKNLLLIGISHYLQGNLIGIFIQDFNQFSNNLDDIIDYLSRYYSQNFVPPLILLDTNLNADLLKKELQNINISIKIKNVDKSEMEYIKQIKRNLTFQLEEIIKINKKIDLKNLFPEYPNIEIIDGFDISHISGMFTIGGVVRFKHLEPVKSMFRTYLLPQSPGKPDDFNSIYLALKKHIMHLKKHGYYLPDLIIIDGGKGHLNMAKKALNELEIDIPLMAIAKRKFDKIYLLNRKNPLIFSRDNPLLQYIVKIRDSVHKLSIEKHRAKREKLVLSFFDDIKGIGEKRAKKLILNFKTLSNIYNAENSKLKQFIPEKTIAPLKEKLKFFLNK